MLTPSLPADAFDMTVLEWRLEEDIVAAENAMWDTAEEAGAGAEGQLGLDDDDEDDEEGSNLKGRYRLNGDGARGGGGVG